MAVATNGASTGFSVNSNTTANVAITFNYTCPANTDCLVLVEGNVSSTGLQSAAPTALSYNGVAMTMVPGSESHGGTGVAGGTSIWYLLLPPTGSSLVMSVKYADALSIAGSIVQPLIGVNQSGPVGTAAIATGSGTTAAVTATGGSGTGSLYLASMQTASASGTTASPGGSQTQIKLQVERSIDCMSLDSAIAGSSGVFSWTIVSSLWDAAAVAFLPVSLVNPTVFLLS